MAVTVVMASPPDNMGALIGLGGALLGAMASFAAVWLQQHHAAGVRKDEERRAVEGLLKAIDVEITVLFARYEIAMAPVIREADPGEPIRNVFPTPGDYFTVYSANAALLGQVVDDELRSSIVRTYTLARAMLETFVLNSAMSVRLDDLELANSSAENPAVAAAIINLTEGLTSYAQSMRDADMQLAGEFTNLKRLLRERAS